MGELIQDLKRELREEILQGMSYERQMTDEELAQVIDGKILEQMEREPMGTKGCSIRILCGRTGGGSC